MAKETLRLPAIVLTISFVASSHAQQSLTEYLLASLSPQGIVPSPSIPAGPINYQSSGYGPGYQNYQTVPAYPPLASPAPPKLSPPGAIPSPLKAIANLAASIPVSESKLKTPAVPKSSDLAPGALDSNVLNNLAIALQLLIVSNILNTPPSENLSQKLELSKFESMPKFENVPISPLTLSYPLKAGLQSLPYIESPLRTKYSYESVNLPNSNFIGSSGFVEPPVFGSALTSVSPKASPRSSMTLMSPYEALGPNSPFSDPILSTMYGTSYSKRDFQSPYASILAADGHKDLFSVSDLF